MIKRICFLIIPVILFNMSVSSQVITSEKSSIHIKSKKEVKPADEVPPVITIMSPDFKTGEPVVSHEENISVVGQVTDDSEIKTLFVNGVSTELAKDNVFVSKITLKEGSNEIAVIAVDQYNNVTESKQNINFYPEIVFRTLNGKGSYYALLIGIDKYSDPAIPDLDNPINDASRLQNILVSKYTFQEDQIKLLKNPGSEELIIALDELAHRITPDDNLLIFYAGHGWFDEKANIGYWLPSDAKQVNKAAWFRNSTLCDYLREIDSKHTLLIADACFGGSIFKTRAAFPDATKAVNMLYELRSRKAMTSGTLTEVPDRSSFVKYLLDRLNENTEKYLTSEQLFSSFRMAVINNSDVVPQYGEIYNVGDEGGDFVFIRK
jgi:hypothetical protein